MRSFATALALVLLASAAVAFDCDGLKEPARTKCLDRAAEMHIRMMPAHDTLEVTAPKDDNNVVYDDTDDVDDVMGDLGEGASARAKVNAKAGAKQQAQQELKVAEAQTAGMYDDDIKVAKAFSDLDDEMDDLKYHVNVLHSHMRVANTESEVREEYEREEQNQKKMNDLGESDSVSSDTAHRSMGVLDASADDLEKDLTVDFHQHTAATEEKADDLMKDMADSDSDMTVSPLDSAEELLQTGRDDSIDDGLSANIVLQDLASGDKSLTARAAVEAEQAESMDDEADLEEEANDLGDTADTAETGLDAIDETFANHPSLNSQTLGQKEAAEVVEDDEDDGKATVHKIGILAQDSASKKALNFMNEEDRREESAIKKAQKREKKQEKEATKQMYAEMKKMNDEVTGEEQQLEGTKRGKKATAKTEKH
jgi:hypothetical protein